MSEKHCAELRTVYQVWRSLPVKGSRSSLVAEFATDEDALPFLQAEAKDNPGHRYRMEMAFVAEGPPKP